MEYLRPEKVEAANNITEEEWGTLLSAIGKHPSKTAIEILRENKNRPTTAIELFGEDRQNSGQAHPNSVFLKRGLPFRLVRIGQFDRTAGRRNRLIALVRWQ